MANYKNFINLLIKYKLINPIYKYLLELISSEIVDSDKKEDFLIIFAIYFSLIGDGNIGISTNKNILINKWTNKLNASKITCQEKENFIESEFNDLINISIDSINNNIENINSNYLPSIIGDNKIFLLDDNWLYLIKYQKSRKSIIDSIKRLYINNSINNKSQISSFNYDKNIKDIELSNGQKDIYKKGINHNLIITGGPGTGKTTSIFFLLLNLLSNNLNQDVYLLASSGKASSRMKESIINNLKYLKEEFIKDNKNKDLIEKIQNLEESTIHRLLSFDYKNGGFLYNKDHQFNINSIFIIDEASMIDICIFEALLLSIPTSARVFIMGDKNQLPSVECGAVFADLLNIKELTNNIVMLDESKRFGENTKIFKLANAINKGSLTLPINDEEWRNPLTFKIENPDNNKPIFYYSNQNSKKENIDYIVKQWGKHFYSDLQDYSSNLKENDFNKFSNLFKKIEEAKILCAENDTYRGVSYINSLIIREFIDKRKKTSLDNYFTGELIIIKKNNKQLDLYNGDSGILVTFVEDDTLYFMIKKTSSLINESKKQKDKIFKLEDDSSCYVFYPFRMLAIDEFDFAYAITIHKSQGSDYNNILVILPITLGHPLINRQIVYTAITRTKGNTYILSSKEILESAAKTLIVRDTNIKL